MAGWLVADIPSDSKPLFSISYWIRSELWVLLRRVNIRNWLSAGNLWKYSKTWKASIGRPRTVPENTSWTLRHSHSYKFAVHRN
jgi:hypothetical protein